MSDMWFIRLVSRRDDGKFVALETDEEYTLEEAIQQVIDAWDDMPGCYTSWDLEKVCFKDVSGSE